jgi:serine/threonine protein kinase
VWKGKWHNNNVAIKQLKVDSGTAALEKAMVEFANEIGRMASMQPHENVVLLYGVTKLENGDMAAVVEYCAHGSCLDALYGSKPRAWTDDELIRIARGAASGIAHLHRLGIIHRDIAARNVLLTQNDVAKVADFGMSRVLAENANNEQQTVQKVGPLKWMAPEQIERHVYSKATDVFSFGVLLFEIFAREAPWKDTNNIVACHKSSQWRAHDAAKARTAPNAQTDGRVLGARAKGTTTHVECAHADCRADGRSIRVDRHKIRVEELNLFRCFTAS